MRTKRALVRFGLFGSLYAIACGNTPAEGPAGPEGVRARTQAVTTTEVTVDGEHDFTGDPHDWWEATGVYVAAGDQITAACTDGVIGPWGWHEGFGCSGDTTHLWNRSVAPECPFGSLVGKVGVDGTTFCLGGGGPETAPASGSLFLAFNDGVNFADNYGSWTVNVSVGGGAIGAVGMPFGGRINVGGAAEPGDHQVHDGGGIAEWSTDLYAPAGTDVTFYVSDGFIGYVSAVGNACANAGQYVSIELYRGDEIDEANRVGRAYYTHLDDVQVSANRKITSGTLLGKTERWDQDTECYDVAADSQVHIHFELGTHPNASTDEACWLRADGSYVGAGQTIGLFGATGLAEADACPP